MSFRIPFILVPMVCASVASVGCAAESSTEDDADALEVDLHETLKPQDTKKPPPPPKDPPKKTTTWSTGNKLWDDDWLAPK
jgi:hypothetical protein